MFYVSLKYLDLQYLSACERLNIVTINSIAGQRKALLKAAPPATRILKPLGHDEQPYKMDSMDDLKKLFPDRFDCIRDFKGKVRLHLKPDAKSLIDAPQKWCSHQGET